MAWIGKAQGVFKLHDSDSWCGSLLSLDDAAEILAIAASDLVHVPQRVFDGASFIDELDLHKHWSDGKLATSPYRSRISSAKVSLDELILKRLVEVTLPGALVEQQVQFGRRAVDLRVSWKGQTRLLEFVGPSHFVPGAYNRALKSPLDRKREVEAHFGDECVIWPFWIQRCTRNVRALFDPDARGVAAVWSTKAHFGDFGYSDSAQIISILTSRFNAFAPSGIGYMYGCSETPNKPIHPIVAKVTAGRVVEGRLIPAARKRRKSGGYRRTWPRHLSRVHSSA